MSDGIVIPIDGDDTRIQGKLARIKKNSADAGREFGRAQSQAARIGGQAGGIAGRALGGFAQGGAAGMVGLGLTAAGVGLHSFLARDAERVTMARTIETRQQERDARARTVLERKDALAAGGMSHLQTIRRAGFRGDTKGTLAGFTKMAGEWGLSSTQGLDIYEATREMPGVSPEDVAKGMATGVLGDTAQSVASKIKQYGGVTQAVAATQKMTTEQAGAAIDRMRGNALSVAAGDAASAMNGVENAQVDALVEGKTGDALRKQAADILNPGAKLMAEASQRTFDTVNQLRAAADAQSTVAALLAEAGRVIGMSEGSEARKLGTFVKGGVLQGE